MFRDVAWRTVKMAVLVTIADVVLAFPIAYYMARVASPRTRDILVIAVLMPLWANYLVKAMPGGPSSPTAASSTGRSSRSASLTGTPPSGSGSPSPTSGCRS